MKSFYISGCWFYINCTNHEVERPSWTRHSLEAKTISLLPSTWLSRRRNRSGWSSIVWASTSGISCRAAMFTGRGGSRAPLARLIVFLEEFGVPISLNWHWKRYIIYNWVARKWLYRVQICPKFKTWHPWFLAYWETLWFSCTSKTYFCCELWKNSHSMLPCY